MELKHTLSAVGELRVKNNLGPGTVAATDVEPLVFGESVGLLEALGEKDLPGLLQASQLFRVSQ
jgi:hypothetical protein